MKDPKPKRGRPKLAVPKKLYQVRLTEAEIQQVKAYIAYIRGKPR